LTGFIIGYDAANLRASITLKSNVEIIDGIGTLDDPYIIG
jgi:uncharacterized membrane protein